MTATAVHPALVAAIGAEYTRALECTAMLAEAAAAPENPQLQARARQLRAAFASFPEFLASSSADAVRGMLLKMFGDPSVVDSALQAICADVRCYAPAAEGAKGVASEAWAARTTPARRTASRSPSR